MYKKENQNKFTGWIGKGILYSHPTLPDTINKLMKHFKMKLKEDK